jgi:hypothetical protein
MKAGAASLIFLILTAPSLSGFIPPLPPGDIQDWKRPLMIIPQDWIERPSCICYDVPFLVAGKNTISNTEVVIYLTDRPQVRLTDVLHIGKGKTDAVGNFTIEMVLPSRSKNNRPIPMRQPSKFLLDIEVENGRERVTIPIEVCESSAN